MPPGAGARARAAAPPCLSPVSRRDLSANAGKPLSEFPRMKQKRGVDAPKANGVFKNLNPKSDA